MTFSQLVVQFFSILTLVGQVTIIAMIVLFFSKASHIKKKVANNRIGLTLLISGIATFGSLVFSLILGFAPCELCWYQRIFMYPIAVISFVGLIKNEASVARYVVPLAIIGSIIALYHVLLQIFPTLLQCTDEVAKCSTIQFAFLGYITIPVMALTAFVMILFVSIISSNTTK